ncbi:MAG TPA: hypothetical protein PL020_04640, partial [Candidatus Cloacimonadota bacterium]|nr:hypothetical protein [Candidatus Cloacimonadota bacterium]
TITNCYSYGSVSGTSDVGGLIGYNTDSSVTRSYWDTQTSGQATSAGGGGRTTAEMTYPYATNTYQDWDFTETWVADSGSAINDGYPYLRWQNPESGFAAPTNLSAVYDWDFHAVLLSWDIPSPYVLYYRIYRSTSGDIEDLVEYDLVDGSPYVDDSGNPDYLYAISAIYETGESALSNYAWAGRMEPVAMELNIRQNEAQLSWQAKRDAIEYLIYWSDDPYKLFPSQWAGPENCSDTIYNSPLVERRFFRVMAKIPSRRQINSSSGSKPGEVKN